MADWVLIIDGKEVELKAENAFECDCLPETLEWPSAMKRIDTKKVDDLVAQINKLTKK